MTGRFWPIRNSGNSDHIRASSDWLRRALQVMAVGNLLKLPILRCERWLESSNRSEKGRESHVSLGIIQFIWRDLSIISEEREKERDRVTPDTNIYRHMFVNEDSLLAKKTKVETTSLIDSSIRKADWVRVFPSKGNHIQREMNREEESNQTDGQTDPLLENKAGTFIDKGRGDQLLQQPERLGWLLSTTSIDWFWLVVLAVFGPFFTPSHLKYNRVFFHWNSFLEERHWPFLNVYATFNQ